MGLFDWMHDLFSTKTEEAGNSFFTVETSEGELVTINTSDSSSPFYGSSWTKILKAYETKDYIRGRVMTRCVSRDSRFSGYSIDLEGVEAFIPASKAAWYYSPERDACGKYLAVGIESVYTSGGKAGKLVVNAYAPVKYLYQRQGKKDYAPGGTPYAMAMDYDNAFLFFQHYKGQVICVPIDEALNTAKRRGLSGGLEVLTGYCWQVRILGWKGDYGLASAVEVLV